MAREKYGEGKANETANELKQTIILSVKYSGSSVNAWACNAAMWNQVTIWDQLQIFYLLSIFLFLHEMMQKPASIDLSISSFKIHCGDGVERHMCERRDIPKTLRT